MSKHETFTAPETIETVALSDLYLSDINPRQHVADEGIALLVESLVACGLIQNLSGLRDADGKVGIVAGGRRLRALNIAVTERADLAQVPVKITDNPFVAEQWANAENTAREELEPVDEVRAYGKMAAKSLSVAKISQAFGVTEAHVRRRLALAGLPEPVLDALKDGVISLGNAKAMTVSDDAEKILEVLDLLKSHRHYGEYDVKRFLKAKAVTASTRIAQFVGREAYEAKGGTVTADLFAQNSQTYFNDPDILDTLFVEKLEAEAEVLREAEGWAWAKVTDDSFPLPREMKAEFGAEQTDVIEGALSEEQAGRYDELAELAESEVLDEEGQAELDALQKILDGDYQAEQKALAGVMVYVDSDGDVRALRGLILPDQQAEAVEAGFIDAPEQPAVHVATNSTISTSLPEKSPYSQVFVDDMKAIRLAAVQTALLDKPDYLLSLFAFAASPAPGSFYELFGFGYDGSQRNQPEIDDQFTLDPRLGGERDEAAEEAYQVFRDMDDLSKVDAFKAFRDLGKKVRNGEITTFLARRFKYQDAEFMSEIEADIGADIRSIWTPSAENCFKRIKGELLEGIYMNLLGLQADSDKYRAFSKSKKGEKDESLHKLFNDPDHREALNLTAEQKTRIDAWVPDCF